MSSGLILKKASIHKGFIKYFKNTSWLFLNKILQMGASLVIGAWLARYLGPEQFGILNYAQSIVALYVVISTLGLEGIVTRELIVKPEQRGVLLGTSFFLSIFGSVLMILLLLISMRLTSTDQEFRALILIIASGQFFQSLNIISYYFSSRVLSKFIAYASSLSILSSGLIKIVLILLKAPLIAFAFVILFEGVILAVGLIYFYRKGKLNFKDWKFDFKLSRVLLSDSAPLMLSIFSTAISLKISAIIINEFLDAESLGLYAASLRIIEVWYFIPVVLTTSFFPSIVGSMKTKEHENKVKALSSAIITLSVTITVILVFFRKGIVSILFGPEYYLASDFLLLHSIALVFVSFASLRKKLLIAENKTKIIMYYSVSTAIIMIVSNILLVKFLGVSGAPLAFFITWASTILIVPILFGRFKEEVLLFLKSFNPVYFHRFLMYLLNSR